MVRVRVRVSFWRSEKLICGAEGLVNERVIEEGDKSRQLLLWRAGRLLVSLSVFWKLFRT